VYEQDSRLESAVRAQLDLWFQTDIAAWKTLDIQHIHYALPSQGVGEFLPDQPCSIEPFYVAGDYRETTSIHGAMASGRKTAEAILARRSTSELRRSAPGGASEHTANTPPESSSSAAEVDR
jgi:predicted NAD/FAD-dependent oxidoreductase